MKKEKNRIMRSPLKKAANVKKEISRKIGTPLKKAAKWFVIIFISLVLIYCLLCIIAKVLPDPTPTPKPTTVETVVADTDTPTTAKKSIIQLFKSLLILEEFAYTALGAMFGFGASVILENYILRYTKKKAFRNLVDEIIPTVIQLDELRKRKLARIAKIPIVDKVVDKDALKDPEIQEDIYSMFRSLKCYRDVVYFPIWESILQNGDLLYFRKEDYFDSLIRVYTHLIKIKHMIDDPAVDENDTEDMVNYLLQLDMNIKEFLTQGKDFDESLFDAIDDHNKQENNIDYKKYFEEENE